MAALLVSSSSESDDNTGECLVELTIPPSNLKQTTQNLIPQEMTPMEENGLKFMAPYSIVKLRRKKKLLLNKNNYNINFKIVRQWQI